MKIIGISGGTGSGKTYLSNKLIDKFGKSNIEIIELDSYYRDLSHLPFIQREQENFDHPDAFNFKLLIDNLNDLKNNDEVLTPTYDYKTHTRNRKKKLIAKKNIVVIEGIFSIFNNDLRDQMDYKIFIDVPDEIRIKRRIKRDINDRGRTIDSIKSQYNNSVRPMHDKYIQPSKKYADFIMNNDNSFSELYLIISEMINQ